VPAVNPLKDTGVAMSMSLDANESTLDIALDTRLEATLRAVGGAGASPTANISSMGRIPAIGSLEKLNARATAPTSRPLM
jgi:hypothetical protein